LNGIAVTDHNTIRGGIETNKINKDRNFLVITGCEVNTEIGDIIGLFLRSEIKSKKSMDVIKEIKDQGGIVVLPHPCREHKLNDTLVSAVDIIESFNSRTGAHENSYAEELAIKFNKPILAGSDAHFASEVGLATTEVYDATSLESVKNSLVSGNVKLVYCKRSPIYFQSASQLIKSTKNKKYKRVPLLMGKLVIDYVVSKK